MRFLRALTVALVPLASAAVSKITRHGKFLYDESGTRFFIKVSRLFAHPLSDGRARPLTYRVSPISHKASSLLTPRPMPSSEYLLVKTCANSPSGGFPEP